VADQASPEVWDDDGLELMAESGGVGPSANDAVRTRRPSTPPLPATSWLVAEPFVPDGHVTGGR